MRHHSLLTGCLIAACLGASPATQPAVDKAHVQVDRPGCSIVIPKTWKVGQQKDAVITFRLPAGTGGSAGTFLVVTAPLKGNKLALAEVIDGKKQGLTKAMPDVKFTVDKAATLDGRDAWELVYDLPTQAKETDTINGKAADSKPIIVHQICHSFTSVGGDRLTELTYVCPKDNLAAHEKEAKAVFDSLRWSE